MKNRNEDSIWIRSQNKKELVNCIAFSVSKNIGGKKKSAISGSISNGFWGRSQVVLGLYDTEEVALEELNKLQAALVNNREIYEMN